MIFWFLLECSLLLKPSFSHTPPECRDPKLDKPLPPTLREIHRALESDHSLTFDRKMPDELRLPLSERYSGFSYYVGMGNERFEKLEGYEDIYLYIDHYDPSRHPMNRLFLGSSAILKLDRSTTPPTYVYLSRERHVGTKTGEELKDAKNVNEHLCSLNSGCSGRLDAFNRLARSSEFDMKIGAEYRRSLKKRFEDLLLSDVYHSDPGISIPIRSVLERLETEAQGTPADINTWLLSQMEKITEAKIGKLTRQEYQKLNPKKSSELALEYITYSSLKGNVAGELERRSHYSKKTAILEWCGTRPGESGCETAIRLKKDLDFFESRRKVLPTTEGLPTH
jgi:hypothetical protein